MSTGVVHETAGPDRFEARVVLTTRETAVALADGAAPHPAAAHGRRTNRRTHRRLSPDDFQWLRAARLKYGSHVRVIDISAGGMLIETERPLAPDSKMVFELAGSERTVLVACRVLRCDPVCRDEGRRFRVACGFVRPLDLPDLTADAHAPESIARDIVAGLEALGGGRDAGGQSAPAPDTPVGVGWQKVIVRYRDGQLLRGYTNNFHTDRAQLHLSEQPCTGKTVMVPLSRLKALFFVREFAGDPRRIDRADFQGRSAGRKVEITFHDGEVLVGSTISYRPDGNGFFVQPADPRSNNLRVFVILGAIQHLRFL